MADKRLIERVTYISERARAEGYEDVAAWMQKMLAYTIKDERPRRQRGVRVRLGRVNRAAIIDEEAIKKAMGK